MSPFSKLIGDLRKSRGIRQSKLALAIGYEQSYISALEAGQKGPPSKTFILKIYDVLKLNKYEQEQVELALSKSSRKFILPIDAPQPFYELCYELRQSAKHMQPKQIEIMTHVLRLLNDTKCDELLISETNGA